MVQLQRQPQHGTPTQTVDGKATRLPTISQVESTSISISWLSQILKSTTEPATIPARFYVNRLHAQAWVRGDYSGIVVRLSNAATRCGTITSFRPTVKIRPVFCVSQVLGQDGGRESRQYAILRHLPVFFAKASTGKPIRNCGVVPR
jgi:hypothetical protein